MDARSLSTCDVEIMGSVRVGARGQIVIPKEVRDRLGIEPGDSLLTVLKGGKAVGFVKMEMNEFLEYIREEMTHKSHI